MKPYIYLSLYKNQNLNRFPFFPVQSDFPSVNLCAYPFILNAQAKTTMLQTDAELQMQVPFTVVLVWFHHSRSLI